MLIHQPEQMQLAVFAGQPAFTVEDEHAVGNPGRLLAGNRTGHNIDAVFPRERGDHGLCLCAVRIGNLFQPGQIVSGCP
ncbi:hypothetical protein D3C75_1157990 [compost metagenome]